MLSLLGPFWSVKYLNFLAKATNSGGPWHKIYTMFCPLAGAKYPLFKARALKMKLLLLGLSRVTFNNALLKTEL